MQFLFLEAHFLVCFSLLDLKDQRFLLFLSFKYVRAGLPEEIQKLLFCGWASALLVS